MITEYAEGDLLQILEDDGSLPEDQVSGKLTNHLYVGHVYPL